jgi:hypothetical protein
VTRRLRWAGWACALGLVCGGFRAAAAAPAPAPAAPPERYAGAAASPAPASAPGSAYARRLASAPVLYGRFVQAKTIQGIKKPLVSQGDFLAARGRGVIWRTRKPFAAAVAVTPRGLYALEGGDSARAPARKPLHQGNLGATLGMMERVLSGDPAGLEKAFTVRAGGTDSAWTLHLEPKDPAWARFVRAVDLAGGARVDSVAYLEANGDRTRIAFTAVEAGPGALGAWADAAFRE